MLEKRNLSKRVHILIVLCLLVSSCIISSEGQGYVEDANLYLKLSFKGDYEGGRIYISRSDTFGSDYIQFNYTQVTAPMLYYIEPDTIYVIDKDSFYVTDIKNKQFVVKYINHNYPPELTLDADSATFYGFLETMEKIEREDSIIESKQHYTIGFHDNANGFTVFNPSGEVITYVSLVHWLF